MKFTIEIRDETKHLLAPRRFRPIVTMEIDGATRIEALPCWQTAEAALAEGISYLRQETGGRELRKVAHV